MSSEFYYFRLFYYLFGVNLANIHIIIKCSTQKAYTCWIKKLHLQIHWFATSKIVLTTLLLTNCCVVNTCLLKRLSIYLRLSLCRANTITFTLLGPKIIVIINAINVVCTCAWLLEKLVKIALLRFKYICRSNQTFCV